MVETGGGGWQLRLYTVYTVTEDTAAGSQYPAYGTWGRGMDMIISIL